MGTKKQYWLADGQDVDSYGTIWEVKLIDGPHDSKNGVSKAKQLIEGIGLSRGLNRNYVMVCIEAVPDIKVKINSKALAACREMVENARR